MPTLIRTLAALALLAPTLAVAAPNMSAPPAGGMQQPAPEPAARAQAIQQQLAQIRAETLSADADLAQQQIALNDLLRETMRANGHTPEADVAKLRELRDDLQDESLQPVEQETLIREFRSLQANLVGAQQQAMSDEEVQAETQAFREALVTAMREQDPRTDALLQRMSMLQSQMQDG